MSKDILITYTVTVLAALTIPDKRKGNELSEEDLTVVNLLTDLKAARAYIQEEARVGNFRVRQTEIKMSE